MYTIEKLKAMTLEQRAQIYKNCLRKGGPEAEAIIEMLKATGMPYQKDKSLAHGDPVYRAMEVVINNPENVEKMLDAAAKGRPPLEAVDPLIKAKLGNDYGPHNEGTVTAGYLVGQKMYALDYEKTRALPLVGCVAKTAATFRKRKASQSGSPAA
ncbi:hypothetical protein P9272_32100 [Mesorhizobium sp. WSM4976]|uniref:hypothetical protein n=1 Tax=Mesorhizobium sp. WSM4976 TaxID=3038549 RepID=UPI00241608AE|nr:hypothetical protein [Mesorhizobium sp. WSM4976]MDG4898181.1 hypothetical protein [Mesorhizobium sp. WSM4976]